MSSLYVNPLHALNNKITGVADTVKGLQATLDDMRLKCGLANDEREAGDVMRHLRPPVQSMIDVSTASLRSSVKEEIRKERQLMDVAMTYKCEHIITQVLREKFEFVAKRCDVLGDKIAGCMDAVSSVAAEQQQRSDEARYLSAPAADGDEEERHTNFTNEVLEVCRAEITQAMHGLRRELLQSHGRREDEDEAEKEGDAKSDPKNDTRYKEPHNNKNNVFGDDGESNNYVEAIDLYSGAESGKEKTEIREDNEALHNTAPPSNNHDRPEAQASLSDVSRGADDVDPCHSSSADGQHQDQQRGTGKKNGSSGRSRKTKTLRM